MTTVQSAGDQVTQGVRWLARILGLWASSLFLLFAVSASAEIYPKLSWASLRGMPLFIVLAATALGVLIAWRWEMLGGAIAVIGAFAQSALVFLGSGRAMFTTALLVISPFFVAGILFLTCCWRTKAVQRAWKM